MAAEIATIGGGCYWCLEAIYQRIKGINSVESGYSGGNLDNPTSMEVYAGNTGHAECVQLEYDPAVISYKQILEIFFVMHDPTTLNRQGNDVGEIYRSIIFYHDKTQQDTAQDMISNFASELYEKPIVTELKKFEKFWPADEDMQDYYNNNRGAGYCMVIIDPKVAKLRQKFTELYKD